MHIIKPIICFLSVIKLVVDFLHLYLEEVILGRPQIVCSKHVIETLYLDVFLQKHVVQKIKLSVQLKPI